MVYRHEISVREPAEMHANRLLGSAQLSQDTLKRAIDQLPQKLMMVIKAKGAHV